MCKGMLPPMRKAPESLLRVLPVLPVLLRFLPLRFPLLLTVTH